MTKKSNQNEESSLLQKVHKAYAASTWVYDIRGFFILTFAHRTSLWSLVRFFEKNISEKHLEVPIRSGTVFYFTLLWHRLRAQKTPQPSITAIDYSETMIEGSRRRLRGINDIQLLVSDVAQLNFPNDHFQSINVANGLHCFPDDMKALMELFRVLQSGSKLAGNVVLKARGSRWRRGITEWIYRTAIEGGLLVKVYEEPEIRSLVEKAGFVIEEDFVSGNTYYFVARKPPLAK